MFLFCVVINCENKIVAPSVSTNDFNATITSPYSAVFTCAPPSPGQQNGIIFGYITNVTILETNETFFSFQTLPH